MATSGSVDFSLSRDNLIKYALLNVGALPDGGTPTANQYTDGAVFLNMIVKAWHADGMPLWALKEGYILPVSDTNNISLGPSGGHATLSYVSTQLSADSAASDTTLSVDSITGISASDAIGVELDDGSIQWTTVNGSPSGTTVTLATGVTSAASTDNWVYAYTTKIQRPLKILQASRYNVPNSTDTPIHIATQQEWMAWPSKATEGVVIGLHYDPQLTNGVARIYQRFQDGKDIIKIWFQRPFEDFDATGDTPDFPQEWYMALVWMLSWALSPGYAIPAKERQAFLMEAEALHQQALMFGMEEGSVYMQPSNRNA